MPKSAFHHGIFHLCYMERSCPPPFSIRVLGLCRLFDSIHHFPIFLSAPFLTCCDFCPLVLGFSLLFESTRKAGLTSLDELLLIHGDSCEIGFQASPTAQPGQTFGELAFVRLLYPRRGSLTLLCWVVSILGSPSPASQSDISGSLSFLLLF